MAERLSEGRGRPHRGRGPSLRLVAAWAVAWALTPATAYASFLSPELEDTIADVLAVVVLLVVPIVGIVVFWLVHVLPEKIAHQRHHPQFEAIRTLCLLSLVFGGLLWPFAWLWAYSKPSLYKIAYGTDKSPDYYRAHGLPDPHDEDWSIPALRSRLDALEGRGLPESEIGAVREALARLEARASATAAGA